jgi:predicted transcriptional regulator
MSKMIAIRLDDDLVREIDQERRRHHLTRTAAVRDAVTLWVRRQRLESAMRRDQEGYAEHPVAEAEFGPVLQAQRWPK